MGEKGRERRKKRKVKGWGRKVGRGELEKGKEKYG